MPGLVRVAAQTNPPLGQVTTLDGGPISLTAVLQVPRSTAGANWQLALWHSIDGDGWRQLDMSPAESASRPQILCPDAASTAKMYFTTASISFSRSLRFTLKYRLNDAEPWRWIHDEQHIADGCVLSLLPPSNYDSLVEMLPGLDSSWKISSCVSQSPQTQVWCLKASVPPANGNESTYQDIILGSSWPPFLRWFALVRASVSWLAPRHGNKELYLDEGAVLLSFLTETGQSIALLAVCGTNVLPVLRHVDGGGVSVHVQNDSSGEEDAIVLVSVGNSVDNAVASVMYEARSLVEKMQATSPEMDSPLTTSQPNDDGSWYDGLGFCTWNALGQRLTEQKVMDALDKLKQHQVHITNLILDDNWQFIDYMGDTNFQHGWMGFDAEPNYFPDGLKATISRIKAKHPHIHNISVWHAIIGYWGGVSPNGKVSQTYKTANVMRREGDNQDMALGGPIAIVSKDDVARLYQDFYRFLTQAGVDGVKADAQSMLDMLQDAPDRRDIIIKYLDAWNAASLRHFRGQTISCMSHFPQALFHTLLPRSNRRFQLRNSDDYFPDVPSSHAWHVWANAHNAVLTQYLNAVPDWDMFQTSRDHSAFHAAARCVSGGPIYITDTPGEHSLDLISQITARSVRGDTITLRPGGRGKTLHCYSGAEDNLLLKVGNYHGPWGCGTSIMAVFNVSRQPLTELIPLSLFPGVVSDQEYVVRAHTTGRVSVPIKVGQPNALVTTCIGTGGYEVLTALPVVSFETTSISNLGLVGKMTGGVAISSTTMERRPNHSVSLETELKALGVLGVYISALPTLTIRSDLIVVLNDEVVSESTVRVSKDDGCVLEVDVERAWRELGLKSDRCRVNIIFSS